MSSPSLIQGISLAWFPALVIVSSVIRMSRNSVGKQVLQYIACAAFPLALSAIVGWTAQIYFGPDEYYFKKFNLGIFQFFVDQTEKHQDSSYFGWLYLCLVPGAVWQVIWIWIQSWTSNANLVWYIPNVYALWIGWNFYKPLRHILKEEEAAQKAYEILDAPFKMQDDLDRQRSEEQNNYGIMDVDHLSSDPGQFEIREAARKAKNEVTAEQLETLTAIEKEISSMIDEHNRLSRR